MLNLMRILFVKRRNHTNFWPAFDALENAGHEVFVTSVVQHANQAPDSREILLRQSGVGNARKLPMMPARLRHLFADYAGSDLRDAITKIAPDLIVIKGETKLLSLEAARYARSKKIPVLLYNQAPLYGECSSLVKIMRWYFARGREWFTPVLGELNNGAQKGGVYLPFCMPAQPVDPQPRAKGEPLRLLMMGQFHMRRKNHLPFLHVIAELKTQFPLSVVVAGPGDERLAHYREVLDFIRTNDLEGIVHVRNDVPFDRVSELYEWAHVYVLPSDDEPAAVSIAEAMSFGLPVICNDSNATRCYFDHGIEGLVYRNGDWAALGDAIEGLFDNDSQRLEMGIRARERIERAHAPEKWVAEFERLSVQSGWTPN